MCSRGVLSTRWELGANSWATIQPVRVRQSARQTGGLGETAFHFLVAVEKLLERFRVLTRIATVCAGRRSYFVDSLLCVVFLSEHRCPKASSGCSGPSPSGSFCFLEPTRYRDSQHSVHC